MRKRQIIMAADGTFTYREIF